MPPEVLTAIIAGFLGALGVGAKLMLDAIIVERRQFIETLRQMVVEERAERVALRSSAEAERDRHMAILDAHTVESKGLYHMLSQDRERAHESRDGMRRALEELTVVVRAINGQPS